MSKESLIIHHIRRILPEFRCKANCSDCCGPIPFSKYEWKKVKDKREGISIKCPYVNDNNRCDIYENRPVLCRAFGAVDAAYLTCPHGCGPSEKLSKMIFRKLFLAYRKYC